MKRVSGKVAKRHYAPVVSATPQPAEAEPLPLVGRCANCGQVDYPVEVHGQTYYCPVCHYRWNLEKETAPFRRVQRGEL